MKHKLMRITTVPISLLVLLKRQLLFMSSHFEVIAVSSPGSELVELSLEPALRTEEVYMTRKITLIADLRGVFHLYRLMRKESPTIVHTHTPKAGLLGMLAALLARVPIRLHTVAGLPILEKKGPLKWAMTLTERLTSACATRVYCNSKNLMNLMEQRGYCPSAKLSMIGQGSSAGIDTSYFDVALMGDENARQLARKKLGITKESFVYCFIGRMVGDKGVNELIEAFASLSARHSDIVLLLVGPLEDHLDPLGADSRALIERHPKIIWLDFQKEVRPYLWIADIFVFPSYREGFPNVLLQAGAMGLASIASDINGCNEIIQHGINGILIPPKNTLKLEAAMALVLAQPSLIRPMAWRSRGMIQERFESNLLNQGILKEYHSNIAKVKNLDKSYV